MPRNFINKRPNDPGIIPKFSTVLPFGLIYPCKNIKAREGGVHMSFSTRRWHVPSRNHKPSWGKLQFARSLYQSLSQFGPKIYHIMLVPCHDTMPSFMIFRRVLDLKELKNKFLNLSGRATTPRCLIFIPISCMGPINSPKDTHMIFFNKLWCIGACACSSNLNYAN